MSDTPNLLETVAKAICYCALMRANPKRSGANAEQITDNQWHRYEHDARMVIEVINGLVMVEEMAGLPQPEFLRSALQ